MPPYRPEPSMPTPRRARMRRIAALRAPGAALDPATLDLDARARKAYCTAMARPEVRRALGATPHGHHFDRCRKTVFPGRPWAVALWHLVHLRDAGMTETEGRGFEVLVRSVLDDLYAGEHAMTLAALDVAEEAAEHEENRRFTLRATDPAYQTPGALDEEAGANDSEAAVSITRARALRREARRQEEERQIMRFRLRELAAQA